MLLGTTALVASATGAYAVSGTTTTTVDLGFSSTDTLIIDFSGEINSISPGVRVFDIADSITITNTGAAGPEIDADGVGIEVVNAAGDLTGGISIAGSAVVTAENIAGNAGVGILVHLGADISGGITNAGALTGYEAGIGISDNSGISGALTNSGSIYGGQVAIGLGSGPSGSSTMGAITNNGSGVIGVNSAGTLVANLGISVFGADSDITGLITNTGTATIIGSTAAIRTILGGDISGGITNSSVIGRAPVAGTTFATASFGILAVSGSDISGTITNSGTIIGSEAAIAVGGAAISGGIINSGAITGGTSGGDAAIKLSSGTLGSATNVALNNSGTISGNAAIDIDAGSTVYGIINSGAIFGTGGTNTAISANAAQFVGDIVNNSGGIIGANALGVVTTSDAIGIGFINTDSTGGITNTGIITGTDQGIELRTGSNLTGAITNNGAGTIGTYAGVTSGAVNATTGIYVFKSSSVAGGIINSGTIAGTAKGIILEEDSSLGTAAVFAPASPSSSAAAIAGILNNAGGLISGGATGIDINRSTVLGGISNSGNILGGTGVGVYLNNNNTNTAVSTTVVSLSNTSTGVIAAAATAVLIEDGAKITGVLGNAGVIGNATTGGGLAVRGILVDDSGSDIVGGVSNSGTIKGSNAAIEVSADGAITGGITNSGTGTIGHIANSTDGIHVNGGIVGSASGVGISNAGTGTISGSNAAILVDEFGGVLGGISNAVSAVISGGSVGLKVTGEDATISGTVNNSGRIEGAGFAIVVDDEGDIDGITNSGKIGVNAAGTVFADTAAILVDGAGSDISGAITNTGTIRSDADAISLTGNGPNTGGIANGASGLIEGGTGAAISIASGSILGSAMGTGITNASGGTIRGGTNGINIAGSVLGGIVNTGNIIGTNEDAILVTGAGGSVTGGIVNAAGASLNGNDNGIAIQLGASVTGGISNSGTIEGDLAQGIFVSSSSIIGNITNASGADIIGNNTAVTLLTSTLTGSLLNTGDILGGSTGILLVGTSTITGTITNNSGGLIYGDNYGIVIDGAPGVGSDVTGGIVNAGTIRTEMATAGGTGILVVLASTVGTITNSGLIQGGTTAGGYGINVTTAASVTSITNSGTISGDTASIQFGDSASTLTLQTGSNLIGGADGGTGTNDTLVLEGYGEENENFTEFETLTVNASTSGTWILSGTSTVDNVTVNSGTLDIQGVFGIVSTATIAGGTLNVSSGGVLTVNTIAASGDLHVEGIIAATGGVTVDGILSGSGTITGGLVTVNGILSPGNSPGQITLPSLVESSGSTYLVEHDITSTSGFLTDTTLVTGTAIINTNVDIDLVVGAGTDGFQDVILTAASITGEYDDINADDNIAAMVVYDATTATILVAKTDALAASAATVSDAGFVFLDNLQEGARRDGRVWATGYIYNAENEGLGQNGSDFDQDAFGFNAGVDVISQPNLKVGLAIGYLDGDIDIDSSTSEAENDGIFGAAYLNYMNDNFYLDGAVMIGQQTVDTTRTLTASTATASVDATSYGANLEAGFELEALGGRLSPFVKVGIHSASLDGYSEAATAGTGAMTVGEVETQQMRVGAGFRYAIDLGSEDGIQFTPAIKLGLTQEWQDGDSSADIGFVGYTGSTTASLDFEDQTTIDLGLSFDVKLSQAVTAFVGWDAALGDETTRNTGTIGLSVNW